MKQKSEFRQQEQQESQVQGETQQKGREFSSVEELLRFDAEQQRPPEGLGARVKRSIENEPAPPPWWKRMMARLGWGRRD